MSSPPRLCCGLTRIAANQKNNTTSRIGHLTQLIHTLFKVLIIHIFKVVVRKMFQRGIELYS